MVQGTAAPNTIRGLNRRPEIICGRGGGDTISAGPGDIVRAGPGDDVIYARNVSANVVDGGPGRGTA